MQPLELFLNNSYFLFKVQYCEDMEGAAMGSPVNHMVANIHMEEFENKVIRTAENLPKP